ncbi:aspartate aminotransferase family protein [Paenibacillus baekrokdamisoli]|uniref:Aspartate aminotransferase family protein n=1 Tax=Paenibacillus baekrokdamisoli TaxID=1712516 RepID=A0A3G9ITR6_9BACL|nr:aspartate aminotransferase family protein [Paenibacillus baekrokdamisoli]MBB3070800.1 4-aminobutyrate aminotransferase [Paenibacillus baekrokdamisoli]BBH22260.1 aspartate aminotransferase family protein [Paenibacillus baekrokdamisoli]
MEIKSFQRTEGDVNLSSERGQWQEANLSPATMEVLEEDSRYFLHQSMSTPCLNVITNAEGIYLEDMDGNKYMDFHGNSVHQVGYKNRDVVDAVKKQLDEMPFLPRRYTSPIVIELARKLAQLAPGDLNKVLFTPGGTSAIGLAMKLVRKATGKFKTVSTWDSFHGASLDAISVGGEGVFRNEMGPLLAGAEHMLPFNSYRSILGEGDDSGMKGLDYLAYMLEREGDIGAVIMEPIRSTDVQIPPKAYFKRLRQLCDQFGVLLVLDEIPTAFGRTGKMFVHEHYDIVPDIVVIGKGFGGGIFPMAGIIVREGLDVAQDISLGHYTHEKSSVGSAAALATIAYIENNGLLEHAAQMGVFLKQRLTEMMHKHVIIGDVRVIGMLAAIELVTDRQTKEKAVEAAEKVMYLCMKRGLSFKVSGGNVLTLVPPLITTQEQLEQALNMIELALEEVV